MNRFKLFLPTMMVAAAVGLAGCPSDDEPMGETETSSTTAPTTSGTTSVGTDTTSGTETTTTDTDPTTTSTTDPTTGDTDTTGPDPTVFQFADDAPGTYEQQDRLGFPAVNTALVASKDNYNQNGNPGDDVAGVGMFDDEILGSVDFLHLGPAGMEADDNTGLNDDLATLALTPCTTPFEAPALQNGTCVDVNAGALVIPDDLNVDTTVAAGFPNGRNLEAPVIDLILAALLLDLGTNPLDPNDGGPHHIDFFAAVPLNPAANDVVFENAFPYLAAAQ